MSTSSPVPELMSSSPMSSPADEPTTPVGPLSPTEPEKELFDLATDKKLQRLKFLVERSKIYSSILTERLADSDKKRRMGPRKPQAKDSQNVMDKHEDDSNQSPLRRSKRHSTSSITSGSAETVGKRVRVNSNSNTGSLTSSRRGLNKDKNLVNQSSILLFTKKKDLEKVVDKEDSTKSVSEVLKDVSRHGTGTTLSSIETETFQQPELLTGGKLHSYQLAGVEWMVSLFENGLNGILADEMGLGKTIQTIAFLAYLVEHEITGPFLIVAPLSTIDNWVNEFEKFAPSLSFVKYHGTPDDRANQRTTIQKMTNKRNSSNRQPIVITSYEIIIRDAKFLGSFLWKYVIVDEGHRLKNMNCRLIKELKKFDSANRLLLTGTPLQNNLAELWSLLNFLLPDIFADLDLFQSWFESSDSKVSEFDEDDNSSLITSLHAILRPFLLRRIKADVEKFLPEKREYIIYCSLTESQTELYKHILDRTAREYVVSKILEERSQCGRYSKKTRRGNNSKKISSTSSILSRRNKKQISYADVSDREFFKSLYDKDNLENRSDDSESESATEQDDTTKMIVQANRETSRKTFQNLMMQLRLACDSPYLFYYPWTIDDTLDDRVISQSGKMVLLDKLCTRLIRDGHKVLIFSQFTKMLDILQDWLFYLKKWKYCRIDGSTAQTDRQQEIELFNTSMAHKVFLLSTRSGGLGINLTSADTVVLFDSDWNPQQDLQAMDRVHRIGQTRPVIVYRLSTAGTVEQKLLDRANSKRRLEHLVIERGKFKGFSGGQESEILQRIGQELNDVQSRQKQGIANSGSISDDDLKVIMDRSPEAFVRARQGSENISDNIISVNT